MLLAVDVGNTHTALGLYEGEELVRDFRAHSDRERTEDELHVLLDGMMRAAGIDPKRVDASIVASVVPVMTESVVRALQRAFDHEPTVVGPGIKTGMPILYENPREVGADRIVNSIAAYDRCHTAAIVVDFGTATTFDCVSRKGEYVGGVIAPGIQLSAEALFARAARLPKVEIARPQHVVGRNTANAIQSGLVYGYVGLVDGIVARIRDELGSPCSVIATGGQAPLIAADSDTIEEVLPHLTLDGLRLLHERQG
jgi:type III pantothenate kinase